MSDPISYCVKWGFVVGLGLGGFVVLDFVSVSPLLKLIKPEHVWQFGSASFILASKVGTVLTSI